MTLAAAVLYDDIDALWKAAARFWARVDKTAGCWNWTGGTMTAGYGELWYRGRHIGTHRFSFLLHKGELAEGLVICHTCEANRLCVNPRHLYQGTYMDNFEDMRPAPDARQPPGFWSFLDEARR